MTAVLPQVCRGKAAVQAEQKREHARYKASGCTEVPTAAKPAGHGGTPLAGHKGSCKTTDTTRKHGALGRRGRANRPANARVTRQGGVPRDQQGTSWSGAPCWWTSDLAGGGSFLPLPRPSGDGLVTLWGAQRRRSASRVLLDRYPRARFWGTWQQRLRRAPRRRVGGSPEARRVSVTVLHRPDLRATHRWPIQPPPCRAIPTHRR